MSRYQQFDRSQLQLGRLADRGHDLQAAQCLPLEPPRTPYRHPEFGQFVRRIAAARRAGRPVILMMGAHPIKLGLSRFLIDLVRTRTVTHLALNGAGIIHDFELATQGGTSEDVARWIRVGQFGLWQETSRLNEIVACAAAREEGIGEAVGRTIQESGAAHADLSLAAAGWQAGVPVTVHVSIGCDIVHSHPNCDAAAWGKASYTDFLIFARSVQDLEGGVLLSVGTAVMGPEVYLKALSMARNVARPQGCEIRRFTTAVFDLAALPPDWRSGTPSKEHPQYYYRPWKTILLRTVADGGTSYYFQGDHRTTIPTLWQEAESYQQERKL
jgi:hypothetical protein